MIEAVRQRGLERLGLMTSWAWTDDPKRLAFTLSRYKFVAKMLDGRSHVLEVGCGDGFGSRVVRQAVGGLTAIDTDPQFNGHTPFNSTPARLIAVQRWSGVLSNPRQSLVTIGGSAQITFGFRSRSAYRSQRNRERHYCDSDCQCRFPG